MDRPRGLTWEEAVEAFRREQLEKLATPAEVARWLPQQRRRRVPLPAVVRLGRRTGRRP